MIQGPNGRVYRRNRAHFKPICYDGMSFQDHPAKKEEKQPEINSFQDPRPTKVKNVSFQMDTSYMDARSMLFDEPNTHHTPPPSPSSSPQWLYSPRYFPSFSTPASLPSRESSVESHSEDSSPTGRKRHQFEPAFIRPHDVNRGLTPERTFSTTAGNVTPSTIQTGEISQSKSQTGFQHYALNSRPLKRESWELVHTDSFQDPYITLQNLTPSKTITVAYTANHQKLTPFKTPVIFHQIDSFQDPMFICSTKLLKLNPFKTPALDYIVFSFLHGRHPSN